MSRRPPKKGRRLEMPPQKAGGGRCLPKKAGGGRWEKMVGEMQKCNGGGRSESLCFTGSLRARFAINRNRE